MPALILGIDLGGTNCRVALADAQGSVLAEASQPTARGGADALVDQFADIAHQTVKAHKLDGNIEAVGVAVPGFANPQTGIIGVLPNLFGDARDIPFAAMLKARFGAPAYLENDVKTAAIGELKRGWGRQYRTFVFVGIGTGTSAAVVIDGRLHRGQSGQSGEIAYTVTGPQFLGQDFGESGCLETHISGYGIALQYRNRCAQKQKTTSAPVDTAAVFQRAERGDAIGREVIEEGLDHLAVGLSATIALLDPETLIFGGSIGLRADVLAGVERRLTAALPLFHPRFLASQLGKRAQLIGAIENARSLLPSGVD
jgi:predicted NBD/HSP70 family sugar kinase